MLTCRIPGDDDAGEENHGHVNNAALANSNEEGVLTPSARSTSATSTVRSPVASGRRIISDVARLGRTVRSKARGNSTSAAGPLGSHVLAAEFAGEPSLVSSDTRRNSVDSAESGAVPNKSINSSSGNSSPARDEMQALSKIRTKYMVQADEDYLRMVIHSRSDTGDGITTKPDAIVPVAWLKFQGYFVGSDNDLEKIAGKTGDHPILWEFFLNEWCRKEAAFAALREGNPRAKKTEVKISMTKILPPGGVSVHDAVEMMKQASRSVSIADHLWSKRTSPFEYDKDFPKTIGFASAVPAARRRIAADLQKLDNMANTQN